VLQNLVWEYLRRLYRTNETPISQFGLITALVPAAKQ